MFRWRRKQIIEEEVIESNDEQDEILRRLDKVEKSLEDMRQNFQELSEKVT